MRRNRIQQRARGLPHLRLTRQVSVSAMERTNACSHRICIRSTAYSEADPEASGNRPSQSALPERESTEHLRSSMEFHISRAVRELVQMDDLLFSYTGNVVFANVAASRKLAQQLNVVRGTEADPKRAINAGALFAMGLIDELQHALVEAYRKEIDPAVLSAALQGFSSQISPEKLQALLLQLPHVDAASWTATA